MRGGDLGPDRLVAFSSPACDAARLLAARNHLGLVVRRGWMAGTEPPFYDPDDRASAAGSPPALEARTGWDRRRRARRRCDVLCQTRSGDDQLWSAAQQPEG